MPDISMCTAGNCRASDTCRRHADSGTVPTPNRQSYAAFEPGEDGEPCDAYWHTNQMSIATSPYDLEPGENGDGRIVYKHIEDNDA